MTEKIDLSQIYKIEEERLLKFYERMRRTYSDASMIDIIIKFLENEAIASDSDRTKEILKYYEEKLMEGKSLKNFAFEWIRAHKIFREYRKYLNSSNYPSYEVAIDDCIFLFFLNYDSIVRDLFTNDIKEFEISLLYDLFFNLENLEDLDFDIIIEKHKIKCPTVYEGTERIKTKIYTLQQGLSEIIFSEYEKGLK